VNIRKAKSPITVHCNNGLLYTNLEGDLGGITMYHNPYGIPNILLLEDKEQAMLAAANSEIDFSLPPEDQPNRGEIIEILNDKDDDILDQYMKEESTQQLYKDKLPKIEEDREEEDTPKETIEHNN
jgi:hypothetical protein